MSACRPPLGCPLPPSSPLTLPPSLPTCPSPRRIGDLDFWRGEAYQSYFEHLEAAGGFYYERWGDAPVHSIGAGLLARKDQIRFFSDIGYFHGPYSHCPIGDAHATGRCSCKEEDNFDDHWFSCTSKWKKIHPGKKWYGSS